VVRAVLATSAAIALSLCSQAPAPQPTQSTFLGVPLAPNVRCADPACRSFNVEPYVRIRTRYGIGCMGDVPPGSTPNPLPPPLSFAVKDLGKSGMPRLSTTELHAVRRIERIAPSPTLRFAWVDGGDKPEFIIFNASDGPCEVWAAGYQVLNGYCNEFYQPGENPYHTHAVPDCSWTKPWGTPTPKD
jgi:hypothetical protein